MTPALGFVTPSGPSAMTSNTLSIEHDYFDAVSVGAGKIRFDGINRGADELPRDAFVAQLPGRDAMRGEWRQRWAEDGNDFDVEIVSFGYPGVYCLSGETEDKAGKQIFTMEERALLQELVHALFSNVAAREKDSAFMPARKGRFLGRIYFLPGWIEQTKTVLRVVRSKS